MTKPFRQHLIDPEICIRCYTCEMTCPIEAISHDDNNVVVDAAKCNYCMDCIPVCPTGSIDEWRVVTEAYSLDEQFGWTELPEQGEIADAGADAEIGSEAFDDAVAALLAEAHKGAGGKARAPETASKPTINMYNLGKPAEARVQGNYRLTDPASDSDVRHIILDLGGLPFPVLEGQSVGIIPPGTDAEGKPHLPRLYSVSSPRDGERPNFNNLSLTVKREPQGVCSNYVCDLQKGDTVKLTGPFGSTFLLPSDPEAHLLMICTGTGSAPFRGFTMRRQRETPGLKGSLTLVFGARRPGDLPYFGPLKKVPETFMRKLFAFSRQEDAPKQYVQDMLRQEAEHVAAILRNPKGHVFICGLKAMEHGVEEALSDIARGAGLNWPDLRDVMRDAGRYHVETYRMTHSTNADAPAPYVHDIRVGWGHCDLAHIAFTGHIPWFALEAIDAWWQAHLNGDGWFQLNIDRNVGTPFVHMSLDFPVAGHAAPQVAVRGGAVEAGNQVDRVPVVGKQDGKTCFEGRFVSVFVISDQHGVSIPAPDDIRAVVERYLIP